MQEENKLENYKQALRRYRIVIDQVSGTGNRGQGYIDREYENVVAAHNELLAHEKISIELPPKVRSYNDGTSGISTGLSRGWTPQ